MGQPPQTEPPSVIVRDAEAADRPVLVRFMAALQDVERTLHPNRLPGNEVADGHLAYLESLVRDRRGRVLVADYNGAPAGFLICMVEAAESYIAPSDRTFGLISDLFVVPERRGGGIGRALMAEAEAHFRSLGMAQILIATMAANRPAYETYRELGYADYEIVMEKRLDRPD